MAARAPTPQDEVEVINAPKSFFGDLYHELLRTSWRFILLAIALLFLITNTMFAFGYLIFGGVANAQPGSFRDAFFFSVQTLGTIGYGSMHPLSTAANVLVTLESIAAVIVTALSTGLVFAKFSMPTARVEFSQHVTIFRMDGKPTLGFRVANRRGNWVVEATVRVVVIRTEKTLEGTWLYRMYDLALSRDRSPAMGRSWTITHTLAPGSPLYQVSPEMLKRDEIEIVATLVGIDGDTSQTIHARHRWVEQDIRFGVRHADMLRELPDGRVQADFSRFHDLVPAPRHNE
jgi:inward rectifier potassium channel